MARGRFGRQVYIGTPGVQQPGIRPGCIPGFRWTYWPHRPRATEAKDKTTNELMLPEATLLVLGA